MAYHSKFDQLETKYGKPIGEILVDKLNECGSVEKAAAAIDISTRHVINKIAECGIEKDVSWRLPEVAHEPVA